MSTFFSADICLARVLGKRARARTCQMLGAVDIDRKEMAASSTGISVGAWTKREVQELETSKWRERGMMMAWEWARGGGVVLPYTCMGYMGRCRCETKNLKLSS